METISLTIFYLRRLFSIKHIMFFVILFISFFSLGEMLKIIVTSIDTDYYMVKLNSNIINIMIFSLYINTFLLYSYSFLKKNRLIANKKDNFIRVFIILSLFFILYSLLLFSTINIAYYKEYYRGEIFNNPWISSYGYKLFNSVYFFFFVFLLIGIFELIFFSIISLRIHNFLILFFFLYTLIFIIILFKKVSIDDATVSFYDIYLPIICYFFILINSFLFLIKLFQIKLVFKTQISKNYFS